MDRYRELYENLKGVGGKKDIAIWQGIVRSVEGATCTVEVGSILVPDVKIRASMAGEDNAVLIIPAVNTAVVMGSLSGDLNDLVVLRCDRLEKIILHGSVEMNGKELGGLIKIEELTSKLNALVEKFNAHTHVVAGSATLATQMTAQRFSKEDYEDNKITH
jgi:hypothetical protein